MDIFGILYTVAAFLIVILVTWLIARLMSGIIARLLRRNTPLVAAHAKRLVSILIWVIGLLFGLEQIGIKVDLMFLLIALGGIAVIVAMKDALQNIASKYFSDVYVPFKVGDSIRIGGNSGKVIEINPMSTILISDKEEMVSIPNSMFLKMSVVNTTPQAWKEIAIPISISAEIDIAQFENDLMKKINKMRINFDERFPPTLAVKNRSERSMDLLLTLMIKDPSKKDMVIHEVNYKISETVQQTGERTKKK